MTFFCLQPHDDVADAAINDAVAVINDRTLLNDVDGLVLISVLQSQNISFFAVFIMCFGLMWLQFPMLPFSSGGYIARFSIWTYLSRFILPPLVEPTSGKKSEFPYVNLVTAIFNGETAVGTGKRYIVHQLFEIFEFVLLCFLTLSIGFAVLYLVYKFYKFGSDPIRTKSAQELKILFASSSSSGNLNSASVNSSVAAVKVSYTSPSNVILKSIKRFNASTAFSSDSNTASISLQHFV